MSCSEEIDLNTDDHLYSDKDINGFQEIGFDETLSDIYKLYKRAAHGMVFARDSGILFDQYYKRAAILMQMRFDGTIGFTGGIIDESDESIVSGLNREFNEEINMEGKNRFDQKDYLNSYICHNLKIVLHFYMKEISLDEIVEIEKNAMTATHYGSETLGIMRVPCYIWNDNRRGLPIFLCNQFCGLAKCQLIAGLIKGDIFTKSEMNNILQLSANIGRYLQS